MDKKLPNVSAFEFTTEFDNAQEVFYSGRETKLEEDRSFERIDSSSLETKINRIFNATDFVYKSDVEIETDRGVLRKTVIGKTNDALLTLDNERISISSIKDIKKV